MRTTTTIILFTSKGKVKNVFVKVLCKLCKDLDFGLILNFTQLLNSTTQCSSCLCSCSCYFCPGCPPLPTPVSTCPNPSNLRSKVVLTKFFLTLLFLVSWKSSLSQLPKQSMCISLLIHHFLFPCYTNHKRFVPILSPLLEEYVFIPTMVALPAVSTQ